MSEVQPTALGEREKKMKLEIEKCWGKIFLGLNGEGAYCQILVLSESGIEKSFIGVSILLSLDGYYIEDSDYKRGEIPFIEGKVTAM